MKKLLLLMILTLCWGFETERQSCKLKKFPDGYVCVCNDEYCDTLTVPDANTKDEFILITSSASGARFAIQTGKLSSSLKQSDKELNVEIDSNEKYQRIIGFGGSFTGSVAYLLNKLPKKLREMIYKIYYTNDFGAGYTLLRLPIGGCDFDLEPWAYNEYPENDKTLTNFTDAHPNDSIRFKLLKEMLNVTKNVNVKIIAAAWSAPRWMKAANSWMGATNNQLKFEYYQTWADYHIKYLDLLEQLEIPIWAISTGNEPNFSPYLGFMSMNWLASDHSKWIAEHLGPTLRTSKHSHIEIHTFDDNRPELLPWLHNMTMFSSNVMDFVSGINVHGYFDFNSSASILDMVVDEYPDKSILYTEMCFGAVAPISDAGVRLGLWDYAEQMIEAILPNLLHNMNGYIDWNLLLNSTGGPNYANNVLDAPIIINENFTEFYKQPMFYVMAHFSKFFLPNSYRIATQSAGAHREDVDIVSVLRPDHRIATIFYNKHPNATITVNVYDKQTGNIQIELQPKSLNTLIYALN